MCVCSKGQWPLSGSCKDVKELLQCDMLNTRECKSGSASREGQRSPGGGRGGGRGGQGGDVGGHTKKDLTARLLTIIRSMYEAKRCTANRLGDV